MTQQRKSRNRWLHADLCLACNDSSSRWRVCPRLRDRDAVDSGTDPDNLLLEKTSHGNLKQVFTSSTLAALSRDRARAGRQVVHQVPFASAIEGYLELAGGGPLCGVPGAARALPRRRRHRHPGIGGRLDADGFDKFSNNNGLPPITVTDVPLPGGANSPGQAADAEVLLDIEVAAAVYYYATGTMPTIKMFWAPNDFSSFEAVVKAAVAAGCDVLSISWGADEKRWEQAAPGAAQALEDAIAQAAESGLLVFAASGDNASGDLDPGANVDMPSACPHIIGCGGTTKFPGTEEKVWGHGKPDGEGTGGGFSNIFPMPQWQLDNNAPAGPPLNPNRTRMVPDVAANTDPQTGYLVVINGQETPIGGTTPWRRSTRAYSQRSAPSSASSDKPCGKIRQHLPTSSPAPTEVSAAPGPDPCTGLGVPIGTALAAIFTTSGPDGSTNGAGHDRRCRSGSEAGWPIMSSWCRLRAARLGRLWHASAAQATRVLPSGTAMA